MRADRLPVSASRYCFPLLAAALILANGCNRGSNEPQAPLTMKLTSTSVSNGVLLKAFTCDGQGLSPQLSWSAPPPGARTLALVVTDRDAPLGFQFNHWVVYNIAPSTRQLPPGLPTQARLPDGAEQGPNDNDTPGYTPPCPHGSSAHRYDFILYAVDLEVTTPSASKKLLLDAIRGHVLARAELIGTYHR